MISDPHWFSFRFSFVMIYSAGAADWAAGKDGALTTPTMAAGSTKPAIAGWRGAVS